MVRTADFPRAAARAPRPWLSSLRFGIGLPAQRCGAPLPHDRLCRPSSLCVRARVSVPPGCGTWFYGCFPLAEPFTRCWRVWVCSSVLYRRAPDQGSRDHLLLFLDEGHLVAQLNLGTQAPPPPHTLSWKEPRWRHRSPGTLAPGAQDVTTRSQQRCDDGFPHVVVRAVEQHGLAAHHTTSPGLSRPQVVTRTGRALTLTVDGQRAPLATSHVSAAPGQAYCAPVIF